MSKITEKQLKEEVRTKHFNKSSLLLGVIVLLLLVIVALQIWIIWGNNKSGGNDPNGSAEQTEQTAPVEKLSDSISLPGYGALNLKAGTKEQELSLSNPAENFCQIRISLVLEDGNVVWTSELIPPGEAAQIILSETMEAGKYLATLKYECFRMDENQTPLNGATTKLELIVK